MYNHGLESFLQAKKLSSKDTINKFLQSQGITEFTSKNHNRVNDFIEANWNRFATFVDKGIKSGELKGQAIKLNTYFSEKRERDQTARDEFKSLNLSKGEIFIINLERHEFSPIDSILSKNGLNRPSNDLSYTSKKLQRLPILRLLQENNLLEQAIEAVKSSKQKFVKA